MPPARRGQAQTATRAKSKSQSRGGGPSNRHSNDTASSGPGIAATPEADSPRTMPPLPELTTNGSPHASGDLVANTTVIVTPNNTAFTHNQESEHANQRAVVELHELALKNKETWAINDLLNIAKPRCHEFLWKINKFAFHLQEDRCKRFLQKILKLPPLEFAKHWPKLKSECTQAMRGKRSNVTGLMKLRFYGRCLPAICLAQEIVVVDNTI